MFGAIRSFFAMFATLFAAGEVAAQAVNEIAYYGKDAAANLRTNADQERQINNLEFQSRLAKRKAELKQIEA